jgi:hypothetical protein
MAEGSNADDETLQGIGEISHDQVRVVVPPEIVAQNAQVNKGNENAFARQYKSRKLQVGSGLFKMSNSAPDTINDQNVEIPEKELVGSGSK